jgi:translocation and assembly module TamB
MSAAQQFGRMIRWMAKWLATILLVLVLVLLWLIATETGSRWLLQTALSEMDELSVAKINGTLLNELNLKQLHYQQSDDFSVTFADIKLQWNAPQLLHGHLQIALLQLDGINVNGQPASSEYSESNTEIPKIPLKISIDELVINQLNLLDGENSTNVNQLSLSAELVRNILKISNLALTMPALQIRASTEVHLQSDWPLTADLDWAYALDGTQLNGDLVISGNLDRLNIDSHINGPIDFTQSGFVSLSGKQPEFTLIGDWKKLQWPLSGETQVSSQRGNFQIQGTTQHYLAKFNAEVSAMHQPDFSIDFAGQGNQQSINIEHLLLKPQQGQLNLSGQLSWMPATAFNVVMTASQLNPADFGTDTPGILNAKLHGKGNLDGELFHADIKIKQLNGEIHGQPIHAQGNVKLTNQSVDIQQLQVSAGNNQLLIKGSINEQLADLDLTIDAPDLHSAWPTLTGSLSGKAMVKGSLQKPVIKSNLLGRNIGYNQNQIANLTLDVDYQHGSYQQSKLDLSVSDLQIAENKIERITLQGHGNQTKHLVELELHSPLSNLNINLDGQWNGTQWLGHIKQLVLEHPQLQRWQLESPTTVALSPVLNSINIELPNSCLHQRKARLCIATHGSFDKQLDGTLSLSAWPLALTKPWLPEQLVLSGHVSALATLAFHNDELSADISADISQGKALLKDEDNVNHQLAFNASSVHMQYQHDRLESQLLLDLGEQDFITADIKASKANPSGARQLSGMFKANIANMRFIDGLLTDIRQLQGLFVADLKIDGNTQHPSITGNAQWQNGQFEIAQLGSTFRNINVSVKNAIDNAKRLLLNVHIESGEGRLSGEGHLDLQAEHNFPLQLALNGEKFQISRLPEAVVAISPKLTINKHDNLTDIDGLIKIDSAQIEIKTLPESAIAPSADEVIISDNHPQTKKTDAAHLNTNITIQFGDNTRFSGFGLKTRIAGKLDFVTKMDKQRLQGRAEMRDATYRSYGQDLTIRKGEFLFNGPTDNPWLNIEAIRKATTEDITAVVNVSGPLKSPQTRIYTEPTLPESEALAYLITGKSLKNTGKSDSNAIASAAINYGVGELSWLRERLGIDEFEFEQSEKIEDSAVRLGQYLNPDLYIGISTGLFASKYAVNVRYKLSKHISIDTRAGDTQGIELNYHLEAD